MKRTADNQSAFTSYLEKTRFRFMWNMGIFVTTILGVVTAMNLTDPKFHYQPVMAGMLLCSAALIYMKVTGEYRFISKIVSIGTFLIISLAFLTIRYAFHYTTPMWMMMSILFTFFMINNKWGITIVVFYFIVLLFYFVYFMSDNIQSLEPFTPLFIITFIIEFFICMFGIAYILFLFIRTNNFARMELKNINTQLETQNKLILKQNQNKDIMLKEIHHRVKNNFQIVNSLLRMQSNEFTDKKVINLFQEAQDRILSMAKLHEKMYQSEDLKHININEHFTLLIAGLIQTYAVDKEIKLDIRVEKSEIGIKTLVPLGLIINEIITNSLKYAFEGRNKGKITVHLKRQDKKHFEMIIGDDGIGLSANQKSDGFGTQLIEIFTEQLNGSIQRIDLPGTVYRIAFEKIDV